MNSVANSVVVARAAPLGDRFRITETVIAKYVRATRYCSVLHHGVSRVQAQSAWRFEIFTSLRRCLLAASVAPGPQIRCPVGKAAVTIDIRTGFRWNESDREQKKPLTVGTEFAMHSGSPHCFDGDAFIKFSAYDSITVVMACGRCVQCGAGFAGRPDQTVLRCAVHAQCVFQ